MIWSPRAIEDSQSQKGLLSNTQTCRKIGIFAGSKPFLNIEAITPLGAAPAGFAQYVVSKFFQNFWEKKSKIVKNHFFPKNL